MLNKIVISVSAKISLYFHDFYEYLIPKTNMMLFIEISNELFCSCQHFIILYYYHYQMKNQFINLNLISRLCCILTNFSGIKKLDTGY